MPFPFRRSVLLPALRHRDLGIFLGRFSGPPQTRAALPSADPVSATERPAVRAPEPTLRAKQDACRECPLRPPPGATDSRPRLSFPRHKLSRLTPLAFAGRDVS